MLKKTIPIYSALLITLTGIIATNLLVSWMDKKPAEQITEKPSDNCSFSTVRLTGYQYVRPLLFAERVCQSENLLPVKMQVENLINAYKNSGVISSASVYFRQLNQAEWFTIGESEKYNPGSLLKVPELITFMKMNEKTPGLLNKKVDYSTPIILPKKASYLSKSIEVGKSYTIKELLYYMIAYSDNNATMLLNQRMDMDIFAKVFTDLGISKPDLSQKDIPITVKDYSLFMRVLFNGSYLSIQDSEFCTELLSHSDFRLGMLDGLPNNIKVAHKFGEAGDSTNAHFSETGIVYLNNSPYLLTVMTKSRDPKVLPSVVSNISKKIFEQMEHI